jgi:STE24 endopeptidase
VQLTPVLILPLFFKFKPLPDNDLSRRLNELCRRSGAKVVGIFEWKLSDKTSRANAGLVGWGPTRRVVLSDSLLTGFTASEVEVILAHEIGHHRLGHIWMLLAIQTALSFAVFGAVDLLFRLVGPYLSLFSVENVAGMPLLLLFLLITGLATSPLLKYHSRVLERQADRFALALTGLTGSFISAIEKLVVLNLGEMEPHPLIEALFHSHPAPASRIKAAKVFRRNERQGGGDAFC